VPIESGALPLAGPAFYTNGIEHRLLPNHPTIHTLLGRIFTNDLSQLPPMVSTQPFPVVGGVIEWCSGSPVKVKVTDSQSRVNGLDVDGSLRNEIPISSFFVFEENESGFLLPTEAYTVDLTAVETGTFSLRFDERDPDGVLVQTLRFVNIPVALGSKASLQLLPGDPVPSLMLDVDGDGEVDFVAGPNEPLPPTGSLQILALVVNALSLSPGLQQSLIGKVKAATAALDMGNVRQAQNILGALLHEVSAQSGKGLTEAQAEGLSIIVNHIIQQVP
jgi:hypothetical protein